MEIEEIINTKYVLTMTIKECNDMRSVLSASMMHLPDDSLDQKNATKFLHIIDKV